MILAKFTYDEKNGLRFYGETEHLKIIVHQILKLVGKIAIDNINKKRKADYGK